MKYLIFIISGLIINSCQFFEKENQKPKFDLNRVVSIYYNDKADYFYGGYEPLAFPDTVINIDAIEDTFFLPSEKTANINYQKFDPYTTFLFAEIKENGVYFRAVNSLERLKIKFTKLCQVFIVPNPLVTEIEIDKKLRLEPIQYTPRYNGSYQVTIGDKSRGCNEQNKSINNIKRSKEYEMMIDKLNLK